MILIIDMCNEKDSLSMKEFVGPIERAIGDNEYQVCHRSELTKDVVSHASHIIISGCALIDNAFLENKDKFEWLKETNKVVLGICAGMEIIAKVYGKELSPCQEIGMTKITVTDDDVLLGAKENIFEAYELHGKALSEAPENFEVIAKNNSCIQGIKHSEKRIYGLQFHPEVRNEEIIKNFISLN